MSRKNARSQALSFYPSLPLCYSLCSASPCIVELRRPPHLASGTWHQTEKPKNHYQKWITSPRLLLWEKEPTQLTARSLCIVIPMCWQKNTPSLLVTCNCDYTIIIDSRKTSTAGSRPHPKNAIIASPALPASVGLLWLSTLSSVYLVRPTQAPSFGSWPLKKTMPQPTTISSSSNVHCLLPLGLAILRAMYIAL